MSIKIETVVSTMELRLVFFFFIQRLQTGVIGTLSTDVSYRRRGLGGSTVQIISKRVAETGDIGVAACVKKLNAESCSLFEKIGFQNIGEVRWIATQPCNWKEEEDDKS